MGRYNSTRVHKGTKCWILLAVKTKARAEVGREEEGPLLTPDLSYYGEGAREWCEDNKWDEEKKCCKGILLLSVNNREYVKCPGNTHGTVGSRHGRDAPDIVLRIEGTRPILTT